MRQNMSHNRISQKAKRNFQKGIKNVIKGLSRRVLIYMHSKKSECPNCLFSKFDNRSTGTCKWTLIETIQKQALWVAAGNTSIKYKYFLRGRCPVCTGKGYLEVLRKRWVDCLITWNPQGRYGNEMVYTIAGSEGSTIVALKTDPNHFDLFKNCDKIVIDGVECKLSRPPLLRGLGNQAVLTIMAFTTEKPKVDTDEIIKDYT
jgi:hypothetical protein